MSSSAATETTRSSALMACAVLLGIFWAVEIIDVLIAGDALQGYGVRPRNSDGLIGILMAPLLHGDWNHLIANSVPFLVLGALLALRGPKLFAAATVIIWLVAGAGVWVIGRDANHIGASGVVFGYLGFHLLASWFERSLKSILIAVGVGVVYGGLVWGVLPGDAHISWEGHLCGFLGGGLAAKVLTRRQGAKT